MTITELINQVREQAILHERALREIAPLIDKLEPALDMTLCATAFNALLDGARVTVRLWPNGAHQPKPDVAERLRPLLPDGWSVNSDTGHEWIDASGQIGGYRFALTVYTQR